MANRFIRVSPKIDYLGYDDFMKPLVELQREHDIQEEKIENEEDVILAQLGKLNAEKGDDGIYTGVDANEANNLLRIFTNLDNMAKTLAEQGIRNSNVPKDARNLWKEAIPIITANEEAIKRRNEEIDRQRDLALRGYIFNKDVTQLGLREFTPDFSYTTFDTNKGITFGEQYAKQQAEQLGYNYTHENSGISGQDLITKTPKVNAEDLIGNNINDNNVVLFKEFIKNSLMQQGLSPEDAESMIQNNASVLLNAYNTGIRAGIPGIEQQLVDDVETANLYKSLQIKNLENSVNKDSDGNNTNNYKYMYKTPNTKHDDYIPIGDKNSENPEYNGDTENLKKITVNSINIQNVTNKYFKGKSQREVRDELSRLDLYEDENGKIYSKITKDNTKAAYPIEFANSVGKDVLNKSSHFNYIQTENAYPFDKVNRGVYTASFKPPKVDEDKQNLEVANAFKVNPKEAFFILTISRGKVKVFEDSNIADLTIANIIKHVKDRNIVIDFGSDGTILDLSKVKDQGIKNTIRLLYAEGYEDYINQRKNKSNKIK